MAKGNIGARAVYRPVPGGIEGAPNALSLFHAPPRIMLKPHWHAQVEVNYIVRGRVRYHMGDHVLRLSAGEMCLFWGGQPHLLDEASDDALFAGAHLPLVHFFRLRLPERVQHRLMQGATLVTAATDLADGENFVRWRAYVQSGDAAKAEHAVDELLLRIERIRFEPCRMVPEAETALPAAGTDQPPARAIARICDFIAENFLSDIDSVAIAGAAGLHPKYAMSLFRKSTGMTLNEYLTLLRLSYAQARLLHADANVLSVAMESGFGSLSAFNKAFRRIAGTSPSGFRKDGRAL